MNRTHKDEKGAISLQGIFALVLVATVIYSVLTFLPVASLPFNLENQIRDVTKEYLRQTPRERQLTKKRYIDKVNSILADHLRKHVYEPKDLKIVWPGQRTIDIYLPYTIVINLFGQQFTFDKELDVREQGISF